MRGRKRICHMRYRGLYWPAVLLWSGLVVVGAEDLHQVEVDEGTT